MKGGYGTVDPDVRLPENNAGGGEANASAGSEPVACDYKTANGREPETGTYNKKNTAAGREPAAGNLETNAAGCHKAIAALKATTGGNAAAGSRETNASGSYKPTAGSETTISPKPTTDHKSLLKSMRDIKCPQCGSTVRIPLFWALGIEGIFRCGGCRRPFKTGYKMGAVLSALALSIAMALMQLSVWVFGIYSMMVFVLLLIPAWLLLSFHFRKWYMLRKKETFTKFANGKTPEREQ